MSEIIQAWKGLVFDFRSHLPSCDSLAFFWTNTRVGSYPSPACLLTSSTPAQETLSSNRKTWPPSASAHSQGDPLKAPPRGRLALAVGRQCHKAVSPARVPPGFPADTQLCPRGGPHCPARPGPPTLCSPAAQGLLRRRVSHRARNLKLPGLHVLPAPHLPSRCLHFRNTFCRQGPNHKVRRHT